MQVLPKDCHLRSYNALQPDDEVNLVTDGPACHRHNPRLQPHEWDELCTQSSIAIVGGGGGGACRPPVNDVSPPRANEVGLGRARSVTMVCFRHRERTAPGRRQGLQRLRVTNDVTPLSGDLSERGDSSCGTYLCNEGPRTMHLITQTLPEPLPSDAQTIRFGQLQRAYCFACDITSF